MLVTLARNFSFDALIGLVAGAEAQTATAAATNLTPLDPATLK